MLGRIVLVLVLACGVFAQTQDFDESFTIFIDLDDFHVTQLGNHEFLTHHAIGEHDNVLLELSEAQVKHFMDKHDTHDCEPPSEIHEVVSFIQTAMYENPAVPNFIDDALNSNYQGNMWNPQAQQMPNPFAAFQGAAPFPPAWPASFQNPKPHINSEPVVAAVPANSATTMSAAAAAPSTPASTASSPVDIVKAIANEKNDQTEEEAVARFRDAYRAYKYMTRAMDGLGEYSGAAAASIKQEGGAPKGGWLDSVLDDSDRKILGLFANHRPAVPPGMPSPADGPSFDRELENQINKIVDDTMKNTLGGGSNSGFSAFEAPPASANGAYSDFPSVEQALSSYNIFGQPQQQAQQQQIQQPQQQSPIQQQQQQAQPQQKQHHHHHHHHEAPSADKAIQDIAEKLAQNPEALETLLKIMSDKNPQATTAAEAPKTETPAQPAKAETPQQPTKAPQQPAGSRPAAPAMTSHIDKVSDIIPESIYSKDAVPFSEPIQQLKKVAKRILIPRMEEPGPVIGGGLKPTHIKIPAEDIDFGKAYATRPAPPAQIQMQSSITSAADTNKAQVSVKASTVASANDEALTNPEVVIF